MTNEDEKSEFYNTVETMYENKTRNDLLIIIGDINAKIAKEECNRDVAEKEIIYEITNDNGTSLCNLAASKNTYILSTHKKNHK